MRALPERDLAYIAGFTDGEGTIGIKRRISKTCRRPSYSVFFTITNTHVPVLTWLRDRTELGLVEVQSEGNEKHKPVWVWRLGREEVRMLLPSIMPYLRIKLPQAELMLEFLTLASEHQFSGITVPRNIVIQRQLIWEEITEFNRKGP